MAQKSSLKCEGDRISLSHMCSPWSIAQLALKAEMQAHRLIYTHDIAVCLVITQSNSANNSCL